MLAVLSSSLLAWDQSIDQALASDVCTIDRFDDLTQAEFLQRYDGVRPVILTGRRSVNTLLRTLTLRKRLIREHGSMEVSITTMDARGFRDTMRTSLRVYLESFMRPVAGVRDGERVWYLFADLDKFDDSTRIHEDFAEYQPPHDLQRHEPTCGPRQESPCYARNAYYNQFGIGGRGSGVPPLLFALCRCWAVPPLLFPDLARDKKSETFRELAERKERFWAGFVVFICLECLLGRFWDPLCSSTGQLLFAKCSSAT